MMDKRTTIRVSLVVAIAFFMQFLDTTAVNTAIPAMADAFATDVVHLSTGVTSYLMALAIFIPMSGWIADRYGTRRVFCSAIAFFILASVLCGTSQNLLQFVIYRLLQGMAGAMMVPVGRLAVLKVTPKDELAAAMNYITVPALVAPIVGPMIGGYLTTYWSWRWIFYLNVPISIACILLAWHYIPDEEPRTGRAAVKKPFDWVGFVLSGVAVAGFMYGVELFSKTDVSYWVALATVGGSLAVLCQTSDLMQPRPILALVSLDQGESWQWYPRSVGMSVPDLVDRLPQMQSAAEKQRIYQQIVETEGAWPD